MVESLISVICYSVQSFFSVFSVFVVHYSESKWLTTLHHHHRPRSSRAACHGEQAVLRLQHAVRRRAEYADVPGLHRHAGHAAGDESRGVSARAEDGGGAQLRDPRVHQVGPQAVLLSRPAEGLSDQPVRSADVAARLAGDQRSRRAASSRSESASSAPIWKKTPARACTTKSPARPTAASTSTAPARRCWRSSPSPTCAARRSQGVSHGAEAAAHVPRRLRLQHAGRQPAGRCERQPAHRHAGGQGRHADRRNQEHEQLPGRRAGARLRSRAAMARVAGNGPQTGRRPEANPRLGRRGRRHPRPAQQGRIERLPLLPRPRPRAGHGRAAGSRRRSANRSANCRPRCGRGWKPTSASRPTTPTCWSTRAGRSSSIFWTSPRRRATPRRPPTGSRRMCCER